MIKLAAGIITFLAIVAFAHEIIDYIGSVGTHLGIGRPQAVITVQIPAVHTRERLMNDRFEQVAWLDEQLDYTKHHGPQDLISPSQKMKSDDGEDARPAKAAKADPDLPAAKAGETSGEKPVMEEAVSVSANYRSLPDRLNWFHSINSYRDVVREERALAMLDDRHDMDGNELYFLSFDATVLAGANSNGFAAIEVVLASDVDSLGPRDLIDDMPGGAYARERLPDLQNQDLVDIYFDWLERSQNFLIDRVNLNYANFLSTGSFLPGYDEPRVTLETLVCIEWTLRRNGISRGLASPHSEQASLVQWTRVACSQALRQAHTPGEQLALNDKFEKDFDNGINNLKKYGADDSSLRNIWETERELIPKLIDFEENAFRMAYENDYIAKVGEVTASTGLSRTLVPSYDEATALCVTLRQNNFLIYGTTFRCPRQPTPLDNLIALSNLLQALIKNQPPAAALWPAGGDLRIEVGLRAVAHQPQQWVQTDTVISLPGMTEQLRIDNKPISANCLATLAEYDRLNSDAGQTIPGRGERMDDYFMLLVQPHDDGSCSLMLSPKIHANHWRPHPLSIPNDQEKEIISRMHNRLEALAVKPDGADRPQTQVAAFSYGMSPRLRRGYALQTASNSSASGSWLGSKLGMSSTNSFTGDISEPEIVGYVPPAPNRGDTSGLVARFGWLVGPERTGPAPWQRRLSMQQAELGALAAIPSWWRTVLLRICTGFVSESDLASIVRRPADTAPGPRSGRRQWRSVDSTLPLKDCRVDVLRLPGTAQDVPRRLGVEVVKFPFLKSPQSQPVDMTLTAGRAGKLLLEGGRLWRSTVVMLGAQRADRIEVLPDMQGLTVYFSCVETPLVVRKRREGEPPYQPGMDLEVPVRVWTSEGSTQLGFNVRIAIPQPRGDLCPKERPSGGPQPAAQGNLKD